MTLYVLLKSVWLVGNNDDQRGLAAEQTTASITRQAANASSVVTVSFSSEAIREQLELTF